jgi:DNA (cytosine-5)-methyltransferase 1
MRTHVDLYSGIGGFSLSCRWAGVETIAFAEIDPYASRVLQRHWPNVKNYGDVQNFPSLSAWLLTAGVPCQPASVAGKRRGAADDRWLWPQTLAVIENGNYEWLLLENPSGILSLNDGVEFERICLALEGQGYEVQPLVIPACAVGAPHRRDRVWIVAHSNNQGPQRRDGAKLRKCSCQQLAGPCCACDVAYAVEQQRYWGSNGFSWWAREPLETLQNAGRVRWEEDGVSIAKSQLGRVADGLPYRMERLKGLGNSIVPQVAYQLIKRMIEAEL